MQRHYFQLLLGLAMVVLESSAVSAKPRCCTDRLKGWQYEIATTPAKLFTTQYSKQASEDKPQNLFQQLNLTPRQQNKIYKIRRQYQVEILQLKQNLQTAQQQLAVMMAGTDSATIIREKYQEIAQFRQQLGQLHFESMLAIREVLTPNQRRTFAEIVDRGQKAKISTHRASDNK